MRTSDRTPLARRERPRRFPLRRASLLVIVLAVSLLVSGYPRTAAADPIDLTLPPASLLNASDLSSNTSPYFATSAQQTSLDNLEQAAVNATIHDHGLPSTDAAAVQTWGRDDALAELWGLIVQAIQTPAGSRSADQQNAVDWMTGMFQKQAVKAADDAGLEYVKWAGLDVNQYQNLIANNASQDTLTAFLSGDVVNYNNTNTSQATGGYCVYRSPAPYQGEYDGYTDETCFTPCTNLFFGCPPPTPSYDQFQKWGEADVNNQIYNNAGFALTSRNIGAAVNFGGVLLGTGVGTAVGATLSFEAGSATVGALYPFLAMPYTTAGSLGADAVAEIAGGVAASTIGFIVAIAITAIAAAVTQGIQVFSAMALPGQIAGLISQAPSNTPSLTSVVNDPNQLPGLYSLFVGATLPTPTLTTCDNSALPVTIGYELPNTPCMNAPPIATVTPKDPQFAIQAKGSTATTTAGAITLQDAADGTTTTARVTGNWFVEHIIASDNSSADVQSLRLRYTDWNGDEQTAWLERDASGEYTFVGNQDESQTGSSLDPSTCLSTGTCFASSTIDFVGSDGKDYSASLVKRDLTITADDQTMTYGGSLPTFTASYSGLIDSYSEVVDGVTVIYAADGPSVVSGLTCSAFVSPGNPVTQSTNPGTYSIMCHGASAPNYYHIVYAAGTLTINPAPLKITPQSVTTTYGSAVTQFNVSYDGWVNGDQNDVSLLTVGSCAARQLDGTLISRTTPPGIYPITCSGFDYNHGTYDISYGTSTVTINPAPLTITGPSLTRTYGDPSPIDLSPPSYQGFVNDQDQSVLTQTPTCTATLPTGTPAQLPAGSYVTSCAGASADNYAISYQDGAVKVSQAPLTVTANNKSMTYGDPVPTFDASLDGLLNGDPASVFSGVACGAQKSNGDPIGSAPTVGFYAIKCNGGSADNYVGSGYVDGTLSVYPAPLTITANDKTMTYGGPIPALDASYSGLVNNETATALATAPTCSTTATSSSPVGTYPITCSGAVDANYTINEVAGTLTVTKAQTTIGVTSSLNASMGGQSVTFTANVSAKNPELTPTGTVTFKDGTTTLGTGSLSNGQVTFTSTNLGLGAHAIAASYGGDSNFSGSTVPSALTQYVDTNLSSYPKLANGAYDLSNVNLSGAFLGGASLAGANLTNSNAKTANLTGANLSGANLSNSNFMGAIFSGANLSGANLSGSNLKGATGLTTATLTGVVWNQTMCPDGTSSVTGGTCIGHL